MALRRSRLLIETVDDNHRSSERAVSADPSDPHLHRRHATNLRRAGRHNDADMHELHALGLELATAHDTTRNLAKEAQASANAAWQTKNEKRALKKQFSRSHRRGLRRDLLDKKETASAKHVASWGNYHRTRNEWRALATRVHDQGGNPGLALPKSQSMSISGHVNELRQSAARLANVSHSHGRFTSIDPYVSTPARVDHATRAHADAMEFHYPKAAARK